MICNRCNGSNIKVIESRDVIDDQAIRRRRMCIDCGNRFTTDERIERPQLVIIKRDNSRELFNRQKLESGIYRACEKTSVTSIQIDNLINLIEQELYDSGDSEVSSNTIGEVVMKHLSELNEVAYVRFASVYRRFKDIKSFEKELNYFKNRQSKN